MASNPRPKIKLKPPRRTTPDTKFYIDFEWWDNANLDLKTYLMTRFAMGDESALEAEFETVDLVDSQTGEVHRVDGFQYLIQAYFHRLPQDFVTNASLVDAAFFVILANANQPMTAREIASRTGRPADVVVQTLGGTKIYQGIRPILTE
ncbi:MAG: hypothetical protein R3293_08095 [Candidatus Promineifilaceae bacterium]|nr:hypothetical protein [Candidatus Promineifilaceae bacterium]